MGALRLCVYTKPNCDLCEQALEVVMRVRRDLDFQLEVVDITTDPQAYDRYRYRIPVITLDGEEVFELSVQEDDLRARLTRR